MMNKKEILRKVGGILSELNEQFDYLSQSPDNLNELELELFSANANFLSDHLSILVKLNDNKAENKNFSDKDIAVSLHQADPEKVNEVPEKQEEENVPEWKSEDIPESEPEITFEFEEKQADKLFEKPLSDDEKRVIDENTILKTQDEDESYVQPDEAENNSTEEIEIENLEENRDEVYLKEVVISERTFAVPIEPEAEDNPTPTVNELLSRNMSQQTVAGQYNSRQAKDLKGMISLNDKLLFVRDLFKGYSLAYSEALELLNRFDTFEAADNFLKQNYAAKNNWADKQEVTDKFYEILRLRFAK